MKIKYTPIDPQDFFKVKKKGKTMGRPSKEEKLMKAILNNAWKENKMDEIINKEIRNWYLYGHIAKISWEE